MPGFNVSISDGQNIVFSNNADFSGGKNQANGLLTDGQLWIGSTSANAGGTHINVGTITSPLGTISIGHSVNNITIDTMGGSSAIEKIKGNDGVIELPDASGIFNFLTANTTVKFAGSSNTETLDFGLTNLLLGTPGVSITSATGNVGVGVLALNAITSGGSNTAIGFDAGLNITTGSNNTLIGDVAGSSITTGFNNTALGIGALSGFTSGLANTGSNTAIGHVALSNLTTGINNISFGESAGSSYTGSESNNIVIANSGIVSESNVMRIGTTGSSTNQINKTFVAAITGVIVASSAPVGVNSLGQLSSLGFGTATQILTSNGSGNSPTWQPSATSGTVTSVSGTANRITSTGGTTPVIDIDAAYVGQTSITTLGTVATGTWAATAVTANHGGTGLTTFSTGDVVYSGSVNPTSLSKLAIGSAGQVLSISSGVPAWVNLSTVLNYISAVLVATTVNLNATYLNGVSGVGATLVNAGTLAAFSVDGQSPAINSRVLVKDQSSTFQNGIYTLTTVGTGAVAWVLTRATDYNQPAEINPGDIVPVQTGTINADTSWIQGAVVTTIGTDPITFTKFSSAPITTTQYDVLVGGTNNTIASVGPGSAGQALLSGGNAANPAYSTPTYPSGSGASGKVLISDGTNNVYSTPTFPNASAASGKFIRSDGTNWVASTPTLPTTAGTSGKHLMSDGTNYVETTATYPSTATGTGKILIADGTNWVASTPTYPNTSGTAGKVVISDGTNNVYSTPTFPNASATTRKIIVSDGTNWVASTETYAVPGSSGNVMTSDGTNWTSAVPATSLMPWTVVTGTSQTAAVNNGYIANNAGLVTVTLPAVAAVGSIVHVVGMGAGLFALKGNTGQTINFGNQTTSSAGTCTATQQYDAIQVVCNVANTTWTCTGVAQGNLTVA